MTELDLKRLESDLHIRLPEDYKRFLLRFNGGRPEPAEFSLEADGESAPWRIHFFFSINDSVKSCRIDWNVQMTNESRPKNVIPIASDPFGNFLYMSVKPGSPSTVYFGPTPSDGEKVRLAKVADSFEEFLSKLI